LRLEPIRESSKRLVALERNDRKVVRGGIGGLGDRAQPIPLDERRADGRECAVRCEVIAPLGRLEQSPGGLLMSRISDSHREIAV